MSGNFIVTKLKVVNISRDIILFTLVRLMGLLYGVRPVSIIAQIHAVVDYRKPSH